MSDTKHVVAIVGSLRKESFNRLLARCAAGLLEGRAEFAQLDYADVPFMNQDIEFPAPEAVARVRRQVEEADAVWFFAPEYNGTLSAPLKNIIDWLSRPLVAGDYATPLPLTAKPVAISGVGGRAACSGARADLARLLGRLRADVVGGEGEGFALPAEAWKTGVWTPAEEDLARLGGQADLLLEKL